jgi:hypothetical protein
VNNQWLWLLTGIFCATSSSNMANADDPPSPAATDATIADQARAVGITVKHDAEEVAKAVKKEAKKVAAAAQQGAKEVQATVTHQIKITDDSRTERSTQPK